MANYKIKLELAKYQHVQIIQKIKKRNKNGQSFQLAKVYIYISLFLLKYLVVSKQFDRLPLEISIIK